MSKAISSQATKSVTLEAEPLDVSSRAAEAQFSVPTTSIHKVEADGVRVFYRAAGDPTAPVILSLHGFPALSSWSIVPETTLKSCSTALQEAHPMRRRSWTLRADFTTLQVATEPCSS